MSFLMAPVADCLADESEVVFLRADRCGCLFGSWGLSKYAVAPSGVAASASWRLSWSRLWFSLSTSLRRSFSLCLILFFFSSSSSSFLPSSSVFRRSVFLTRRIVGGIPLRLVAVFLCGVVPRSSFLLGSHLLPLARLFL